jgi:hypothetical protein
MSEVQVILTNLSVVGLLGGTAVLCNPIPISAQVINSSPTSVQSTASATNIPAMYLGQYGFRIFNNGNDAIVAVVGANPTPADAAAAKLLGPIIAPGAVEILPLPLPTCKVAIINA